jgi:hypothetical protein
MPVRISPLVFACVLFIVIVSSVYITLVSTRVISFRLLPSSWLQRWHRFFHRTHAEQTGPVAISSTPDTIPDNVANPNLQFEPHKWRNAAKIGTVSDVGGELASDTTVVIMNWKRPEGVVDIASCVSRYRRVKEVIVFNNNADDQIVSFLDKALENSPSVTICHSARDMGLHSRFAAALLAKTDRIIIQDDDMMLTETGTELLLRRLDAEPDVLHGPYAAWSTESNYYDKTRPVAGGVAASRAPILLTCILACTRTHVARFWEYAVDMEAFASYGKPTWNGEDIVFSLANVAGTGGKLHRVHNDLREHIHHTSAANGISGGDHARFRPLAVALMTARCGFKWPTHLQAYVSRVPKTVMMGVTSASRQALAFVDTIDRLPQSVISSARHSSDKMHIELLNQMKGRWTPRGPGGNLL